LAQLDGQGQKLKVLSLLCHKERTLFNGQVEKVFKHAKHLCRGAAKQHRFVESSLVGMGLAMCKMAHHHKNQLRVAMPAPVLEKALVAPITAKHNKLVKQTRKAVKGECGGMQWGGCPVL
jgi:hypothetical protein